MFPLGCTFVVEKGMNVYVRSLPAARGNPAFCVIIISCLYMGSISQKGKPKWLMLSTASALLHLLRDRLISLSLFRATRLCGGAL